MQKKFDKFLGCIKENSLNVLEALVWEDGVTAEFSIDGNKIHEIFSISKIVTGLAVMKAIELGMFTPETRVTNFFADVEIYNKENLPYLEALSIKHLLTLTLGQEKTLVNEEWIKNNENLKESCVSVVLNYPIKHKPGECFFYSNACSYLLSAIIQKITGRNFSEFVDENIFKVLGIKEWEWRNCKDGICLGATGLSLKLHDVLKIGRLLLDDGVFEGGRVIAGELVKEMKKEKLSRERVNYHYISPVFPKWAYGYNMWLTDDGNYFADGRDGQFLIIMPKEKSIIITLSKAEGGQMRQVVNCMRALK